MLVNTYAHIQQSSHVELSKKFENGFYAKLESPSPRAVPAEGEPAISMTALLQLLKDADPEMKAKLRLATARLMQKRARIAQQFHALQFPTRKTRTVQRPCRNRAFMA